MVKYAYYGKEHFFSEISPSQSYSLSLIAQLVKNLPAMQETMFLGFPCGSAGKESAHNAGDLGSIPGLGRSPGGRHGNPLQYSCPESPMDREAWWATVHGPAKSWTQLSDLTFTFPDKL